MNVPKAVIFDLGKVLLEFDYHRAAAVLGPLSAVPAAEFKRIIDQTPLLHRYETGLMTTGEFVAEVRQVTGYHGADALFHDTFGDIFWEIPAMIALQQRLKARGIPTFIFSNTNELAVRKIQSKFPFFAGFTGYIYSYEVRSMKPSPGIYEAMEAMAGAKGADLVYIDDRLENIEAGAARGWQALLHADPAVTVPKVAGLFGLDR
jgi:putative hydrolase of the HAD superfamily